MGDGGSQRAPIRTSSGDRRTLRRRQTASAPRPRARLHESHQSMNLVGSTYVTGFMIANGYFGSITVLP
jgi:hypothetical protein